jgi:selenocysteine lyase/cysteine desulfurase
MDIASVRQQFPATENVIHLNHAGVSPMSRRCAEAITAHTLDVLRYGTLHSERWRRGVEQARHRLAELMGAEPHEIAFTKNTTHGIIIAAHSIPWRDGDNVVITALEFPANVYPWLSLERRGVKTRIAKHRAGRILLDDIRTAMDDCTRAVAVSWVEFSNGFRNDLDALGELCRERGAYFVVDAIQGLGALRLSVSQAPIDFLAGAAHKWLMGPTGFGYLYCRSAILDELVPAMVGWRSVVGADDYLDYKLELRPDAGRFEEGGASHASALGLGEAVALLLEVGPREIEERVLGLTNALVEQLLAAGFEIRSSRAAGEWSAIISVAHPRAAPEAIVAALGAEGIVAAVRDGAVRLSPHFYNTEEEMARAVGVMRAARGK